MSILKEARGACSFLQIAGAPPPKAVAIQVAGSRRPAAHLLHAARLSTGPVTQPRCAWLPAREWMRRRAIAPYRNPGRRRRFRPIYRPRPFRSRGLTEAETRTPSASRNPRPAAVEPVQKVGWCSVGRLVRDHEPNIRGVSGIINGANVKCESR